MSQKTTTIIILLLMLTLMAFNVAHAGIMDTVNSYTQPGGEVIQTEIDALGTNIVTLIRSIFGILAVIFIMWAGFVFWGASGDPNKMMFAKRMLAGFVICMIFVFMAEKLVGGVLGLIDYQNTP